MINQTIKIRIAESKDAELLAELGAETFHDAFADHPLMPPKDLKLYWNSAFTVSQIISELNDPQSIFLLAEIDRQAVAYAKMERGVRASGVTAKSPLKLKRLYSKQKFIGFGVGALLMKRCLETAIEHYHDTIWLTVWEHNLPAQKFYRKWKFEPCGEIEFEMGNALLTDLIMQRSI